MIGRLLECRIAGYSIRNVAHAPGPLVVVANVFIWPATTSLEGEAAAKEQITLRGNVPGPKEVSRHMADQFAKVDGHPIITTI